MSRPPVRRPIVARPRFPASHLGRVVLGLSVALVAAALADMATTAIGLGLPGVVEINPAAAWLWAHAGVVGLAFGKLVFALPSLFIVPVARRAGVEPLLAVGATLVLLIVTNGVFALSNLMVLTGDVGIF